MKYIFTYRDALTIKIADIGVNRTHVNMKSLYMTIVLLYGEQLEEKGLLILIFFKRMVLL